MDLETFQSLPVEDVAELVRARGPKVCVFPVNGTRRWLMLEHPEQVRKAFVEAYLRIVGQRMIELFSMVFDHGIPTLLAPLLGPDLLDRPDEYLRLVAVGLSWFAVGEEFLDFYEAHDIRVRVYGDAGRYLPGADHAQLQDAFDQLARRTADHTSHRLFVGICAHDATERIAEIGADFVRQHGRPPSRAEVIQAYYGEYVEEVDLFIGFGRPAAFDMPILATGREDLYFTVSPSLYLDSHTLRAILYDHMYSRRVDEGSYDALSSADWQALSEFYALNRSAVLGLGQQHRTGQFWHPLPQVQLTEDMKRSWRVKGPSDD